MLSYCQSWPSHTACCRLTAQGSRVPMSRARARPLAAESRAKDRRVNMVVGCCCVCDEELDGRGRWCRREVADEEVAPQS